MSAPLIFPCISSIQAHDFTTASSSFYLATGITHVPFYLTYDNVCQHISSSDAPATVTFFPTGVPDATPVVCDPLTYGELESYFQYTYVQCPLNTDTLNSGSSYTLEITAQPSTYGGGESPTTSFLTTVFTNPPDQACAMSVGTNGPYLTTLGQNLSPSDSGDLTLYVSYNPLQCQQQQGGTLPVKIVAPDNQVYTTTFATQADLSIYSPTGSYTQALSTRDFGLPANGQLMDGTYTISSLGDSKGTFTVSHTVSPSGMALRRRLESRWNEFVNQPQRQQQQAAQPQTVDSSFFFKANTAACSHTQCPVPGQVGVFECVNTQTDLDSCGGCPTQGGRACGDIVGASEVACVAGKCVVSSCEAGFVLKNDKSECIAANKKQMRILPPC